MGESCAPDILRDSIEPVRKEGEVHPSDQITKEITEDGRRIKYLSPDKSFSITCVPIDRQSTELLLINSRDRQNPGKAVKNFSAIFDVLETDLREKGIKTIVTRCKLDLAPLAIKRYGFSPLPGFSYEGIKKQSDSWWGKFFSPIYVVPLRKNISR